MTILNEENEVMVLLDLVEQLWKFKEIGIISVQEFDEKKAEVLKRISFIFEEPIYAFEHSAPELSNNDEEVLGELKNTDSYFETFDNDGPAVLNCSEVEKESGSRKAIGIVMCVIASIMLLYAAIVYPSRISALSELADDYRESGLASYRLAQNNPGISSIFYNRDAIDNFDSVTETLEQRRNTIIEGCVISGIGVVLEIGGIICIRKKDSVEF